MRFITKKELEAYKNYLLEEEKSVATIAKYMHDLYEFSAWLGEREFDKKDVLEYKGLLCEKYAPTSVNACLSSLNGFFGFMEWFELKVKNLKIQKQIFASSDKEITKDEYERLLQAAKRKSKRLKSPKRLPSSSRPSARLAKRSASVKKPRKWLARLMPR